MKILELGAKCHPEETKASRCKDVVALANTEPEIMKILVGEYIIDNFTKIQGAQECVIAALFPQYDLSKFYNFAISLHSSLTLASIFLMVLS